MTAPLFELRNGELVGDGASRPFSYLESRARKYCRAQMVVFGPGERRVFDRLMAEYPTGAWWRGKTGQLMESVCRDVKKYVEDLNNWTDEELRADAHNAEAAP